VEYQPVEPESGCARTLPLKLIKFFSPLTMETRNSNPLGRLIWPVNALNALFLLVAARGTWVSRGSVLGGVLISVIGLYVLTAVAFYGGTCVALPIAPALLILVIMGGRTLRPSSRSG
jgi:CHASE2 domain-containing sensor protein